VSKGPTHQEHAMTLVDLLDRNALTFGDKDALRAGGKTISFGGLRDEARRAAALLQRWGVRKGAKVAIMSHNTLAFPIAYYGAILAGAAVVPVNHKLAAPEVDYILEHSEASVFLFDGALAGVAGTVKTGARKASLDSAAAGFDRFEDALPGPDAYGPVACSDDDVAEVLYTSGTTGKPKGCLHTHRNVLAAATTGARAISVTETDRMLVAMPLWHSSPLNNWFLGAQQVGATTVLLREYHPLHFLQTVQDEKCTVYFGAPISYILPIQMIPTFDQFDLRSIRAWIYGGGPIGADTARMLAQRYRSDRFYQVYGMTESGPTGTVLLPEEQVSKAGSIGRSALPGAELVVMKKGREIARPGDTGEIWLRADSMMKGYFKDPEASASAFTDGWYRSGDVVRIDRDGYLFVVDRVKDMISVGGENVYSKAVEDVLGTHPAVAQVAIVGKPHPDWGETVVAFVVRGKGATVTAEELQAFLAEKLARFEIPREIRFVESLPVTPTGKIMKYRLREQLVRGEA
jgi:feruloyl-CoA synthase